MFAQENVPSDQQRMGGRWGTDRMVGCYISRWPVEAMKSLAGFANHQNNLFLPRAIVTPPLELQLRIFPAIEVLDKMMKYKRILLVPFFSTYSRICVWSFYRIRCC